MRILLANVIVLLCVIPVSIGEESITTPIFRSMTSIVIDGDFSDWLEHDLAINEIKNLPNQQIMRDYKFKPPSDQSDLHAAFTCFGDAGYIYLQIDVKDDTCVFGEDYKGRPSWDDVIEILFFNTENDPMGEMWISAGLNGNTVIRGRESITNIYPFSLESRGVSASLILYKNGYKTEIAIPYNALSVLDIRNAKKLNINIRVYDDDGHGDPESMVSWAKSDSSSNVIRFIEAE